METVSSLASRYGLVSPHMNPLTRVLYAEMKKHRRGGPWLLSKPAKVALWFFRAMLVLTHVCEEEYCRPFWSLRIIRICLYIAEFDSNLNGIGCIWYAVMPNGREIAVGAGSWRISAMGFKEDSGYQNTCEFMGATMAVVGMIRYGLSGYPFACRGDSMAALTWADKKRYRGDLTVPAGFLFNYIWVMYQVMLAKGVHIPAGKNQGCDDLTRDCLEDVPALVKRAEEDMRKPVSERRYQEDLTKVGDRSACVDLEEFMIICNPNQTWETEEEFGIFWSRMKRWCHVVLGPPPPAWKPV